MCTSCSYASGKSHLTRPSHRGATNFFHACSSTLSPQTKPNIFQKTRHRSRRSTEQTTQSHSLQARFHLCVALVMHTEIRLLCSTAYTRHWPCDACRIRNGPAVLMRVKRALNRLDYLHTMHGLHVAVHPAHQLSTSFARFAGDQTRARIDFPHFTNNLHLKSTRTAILTLPGEV